MTRIVDGYAQPDIVAEKGDEKIMVFVETPSSWKNRGLVEALKKSFKWIRKYEPNTRVDIVQTASRRSSRV